MAAESFRRTFGVLPIAILASLKTTSPCSAAAGVHHFSIPAKPVAAALIDLALQSNLSIGGDFHCPELAAPVSGDYSDEEAVAKLLALTGCGFRRVAPDTILIFNRPRSQPPAQPRAPAPAPLVKPPAAAPQEAISEIVISATKRKAAADRLPYAVSVISGQTLHELGANDVNDIVAGQPTVTSTNLGPGLDKVLLRGLSDGAFTGRTQSTVGLYLDNTPLTYNAPDPDLRLTDVQSVEILRGPQGSLYGGGSMSGVYRIVTRQPQINTWSGSAEVGGSLTQGGSPSNEAEGVLNIPMIRDTAALRLVGYDEYDGGYISDPRLKTNNADSSSRWGGRAALRVLAPGDWTITAGAAYQWIRTDDTQYVDNKQGKLHHSNNLSEDSGDSFAQLSLSLDRSGPSTNFRSTTSFLERYITSRTDASNALYIFAVSGTGSTDGVGAFDQPTKIDTLVEDAVLSSPNGQRWRWLLGLYGSLTRENTQSFVRTGPLDSNGLTEVLYEEQRYDRLTEAAAYGETSYDVTDRLTLTAGLRLSNTKVDTFSRRVAPLKNNRTAIFDGQLDSTSLSPKLALDYKFSDTGLVYALLSNGSRAGGFNTGGFFGTGFLNLPIGNGVNVVNRRFAPDELWNTEVGLKTGFFDRRLTLTAAAFYVDWRKIQTDQFLQNEGLSYSVNAGDGRDPGMEFDINLRPIDGLLLEVNGLFDQPRLVRPTPGFVKPGVHPVLPGVPDVTLGGRIGYRRTIVPGLAAELGAQAEYIGHSHITFDPSQSPLMGGYVLGKVSAGLEGRGWRLAAYVINPTGERGNTFSYGNPFTVNAVTQTTPQIPRTFKLTASAAF